MIDSTTSDMIPNSFVFDLHSDIATDVSLRRARGERKVFQRIFCDRLRAGGVQGLISVLWVEPQYRQRSPERLLQLLGSLLSDVEESSDCVQIVTDAKALANTIRQGKIGLFLGVEGMTFIEQWPLLELPRESDEGLYERFRQPLSVLGKAGLRHAMLTWNGQNQLASGSDSANAPRVVAEGLTPFGREVTRELHRRGIAIDVSHLDDTSIDGVLEEVDGTIIASHSNARTLCEVPRNLSDRHILEIGRRGGVVGINAYAGFIDSVRPTLDRYIDHIVYVAERIGIDHVAFGFDFTDYLETQELWHTAEPEQRLERVEDVPRLLRRLTERGFSKQEIDKLSYVNTLRVMGKL